MCIRHQDKVTTATAAEPCCLFRWDGSDSHQYFLSQREERSQGPGKEKRKETRHAKVLAALQGSLMTNPKFIKDKARGKCLICRQAGHWSKECPNHDKFPKMTCYKCHQLGHWAALCRECPRASRSHTKASLKWPNPASLPVRDNHQGSGAKVLDVAGRP